VAKRSLYMIWRRRGEYLASKGDTDELAQESYDRGVSGGSHHVGSMWQ